jgi:hypothetical protein
VHHHTRPDPTGHRVVPDRPLRAARGWPAAGAYGPEVGHGARDHGGDDRGTPGPLPKQLVED